MLHILSWHFSTKITEAFVEGRGSNAFGFMDTFLDRLFEYIGSKEVYHVRSYYPFILIYLMLSAALRWLVLNAYLFKACHDL